jgi:hypothetical protein
MSKNKGFKGHVVSFFIWIYKSFKNILNGIFGFFDKKLTKGNSETRQWFSWYIGDKKDLEKILKWSIFLVTTIVFVTIGIFKVDIGKKDYELQEGINSDIIDASRTIDNSGEGQLDTMSISFEEELQEIEEEEDNVSDNLLRKMMDDELSDSEADLLRSDIEDGKVSGTRRENQKRLALLDDGTPEYLRKIIRDNLKYGDDSSFSTTIADAAVSSDKSKRKAAEIVANPDSDSSLANFLSRYLNNKLSSEDRDRIAELLRMNVSGVDEPVRNAALLLAASEKEQDQKDSLTLADYLRRKNAESRKRAIEILKKHFPDLADALFNSAYPPNKIREMAKMRLSELMSQKGKLAEEGHQGEEGIFSRILGDKSITLGEYDSLKGASRDTKDKNKIYKDLFGEYELPTDINVKGNEEALARHALDTDDPEIRRIIEKLLRGEELTEEEMLKLKDYLLENDPELFKKLFGEHAYQMHKLKDLLKNRELRDKVSSAIDRARSLGFYEEAELLDRMLAGEDLSEEDLRRLKDYLAENESELFNELFGEEEYYVDSTGRKLTREELEALERIREGLIDGESDVASERVMFIGEDRSYSSYSSQTEELGVESVFTADQSFKTVLKTHVILSDKESSINYRYELVLVEDMISKKGKLIAPKGSSIIGVINSGGVNFDTRVMSMNASVVSLHDRDIPVNFTAGSGDGVMGVRGQVWDYKERKFVGMIVSALGAGIAETANQIIQRDFILEQDNVTIPAAMPSILLGGATEVLTKISEQVGQDLQNAPRFFQVMPGTPVILYPGSL